MLCTTERILVFSTNYRTKRYSKYQSSDEGIDPAVPSRLKQDGANVGPPQPGH
jgi:hypothetical protein